MQICNSLLSAEINFNSIVIIGLKVVIDKVGKEGFVFYNKNFCRAFFFHENLEFTNSEMVRLKLKFAGIQST